MASQIQVISKELLTSCHFRIRHNFKIIHTSRMTP